MGASAVVIAIAAVAGCGGGSTSSPATSSGPTTAETPPAALKVVAAQSFCVPVAADATTRFFVTIRNTGGKEGKAAIVPWRRHNDASVNNGIADQTDEVTIPAASTAKFNTTVPFDGTKHELIECRVILGSDFEHPTVIPVTRI